MKKQLVKYFVTVHTSDISHAGTDADVLVELKGPNGTMGWTALPEQRGDPFGRGKVSEFTIEGTDVGEQIDKCSVKTEEKVALRAHRGSPRAHRRDIHVPVR